MIRRFVPLLLAATLGCAIVACGGDGSKPATSLIWWGNDLHRFLAFDGSVIYRADFTILDRPDSQVFIAGAPSADGKTFAVSWALSKGSGTAAYQGLIRNGKLSTVFEGTSIDALPRVGSWIKKARHTPTSG